MLTVIAPYILVLWSFTNGSFKTVEIPQISHELCETNGHHFTNDLGWSQNWSGYQCIATGYKGNSHD